MAATSTTMPPPSASASADQSSRHALILADEKFKEGDLEGAERAYNEVRFEECKDVDVAFQAYNNRGALRIKQGSTFLASRDFEAALRLKPDEADVWYNLGASRRNGGNLESAVEAFDRCLELSPDMYLCICSRAEALTALGKIEEATTCATRAVELDSSRDRGYVALGYARLKAGSHEDAASSFEEAMKKGDASLTTKKLSSLAHSLAADSAARSGDCAKAVVLYRKALEKAEPPSSAVTIRYNYALTLMNAGQLNESTAQLEEVLRVDAEHSEARNAIGLALLQQGDAATALNHLDKARALAPNDVERLYNYGVAKLKTKDVDGAEQVFEDVLKRDPKHALAAEALESISKGKADENNKVKGVPASPSRTREARTNREEEEEDSIRLLKTPPTQSDEEQEKDDSFDDAATIEDINELLQQNDSESEEFPVHPFEKLQAPGPFPEGVAHDKREMYLSDDQFEELFGVTKEEFAAQPKWKRETKKKQLKLF